LCGGNAPLRRSSLPFNAYFGGKLDSSSPTPKRYRLISADPPWSFATYSAKSKSRSPSAHYHTMSLNQVKALPVAERAADGAILLLWAADPLLDKAFKAIRAWGFTYKTVGFYGVKENASCRGFFASLGFWTRASPEPSLLASQAQGQRTKRSSSRRHVASAVASRTR
jgi:N6-adenosine-specific RNA methylase IME4